MIIRGELRDSDGWISSLEVGRLMRCGSGPAVRAMRARVGFLASEETQRRHRSQMQYRLTDAQYGALLDLAEEAAVLHAHANRRGWVGTEIIDMEGGGTVRLYFFRGTSSMAEAWQWRRDDGAASVEVGTMREALDQLLGCHPVKLRFSPRLGTG